MSLDGTFYGDGTVVRVEGLSKLNRKLKKAGIDATDLRETMIAIGQAVVDNAAVPVLTGRLRDSLRAGKGKTKAVVRMGGKRVPYAGVIEYGWPARGIEPSGAVDAARNSRAGESRRMIDEAIARILRDNDL